MPIVDKAAHGKLPGFSLRGCVKHNKLITLVEYKTDNTGASRMLVHQILKSKGNDGVLTINPKSTIEEAIGILAERRIGGLVVSSDGASARGIISERDIVRTMALRGQGCLKDKVEDIMTRNPVCCKRQDTSESVLIKMTDGRFRHMPVVEEGKLVGIVTIGDVVKARLMELSMEKDALQGMIMGH